MKKVVYLILALFLVVCSVQAYSGGDGTEADPYQIATAEDLILLGETETDYDKYFIMTADIDLAGYVFDKAVIAADTSTSSGFQGTAFTGHFDGNYCIIKNLTIHGSYYCGLFGYANKGKIKNLGLEKTDIVGLKYVGGLCGYLTSGIIEKCYIVGSVTGDYYIGGLCGYNSSGSITNCYTSGSVKGVSSEDSNYIGGLCGYSNEGVITSCYVISQVSGSWNSIGGVLGGKYYGTITGCFWDKPISGISFGYGSGSISGITGLDTAAMQTESTFVDAGWDLSDTDGDEADWRIRSGWYPELAWQASSELVQVPDMAGMTLEQAELALEGAGLGMGEVQYVYNEIETESVYSQFPAVNAVCPVGFSVVLYYNLLDTNYSGGTGTDEDPYQIATVSDLRQLGYTMSDYDKYFIMTADIDMSGYSFNKALIAFDGTSDAIVFTGSFDGGGHVIYNLTITGGSYCGLFGTIGIDGSVKNLGLVDSNVQAYYGSYVGSICGYNKGSIVNCFANGYAKGSSFVGGLCGFNDSGYISNSYSVGMVAGVNNLGGFCGKNNDGIISNCYSGSKLFPDYGVNQGGFCGIQSGENAVSSDCFWDTDISGFSEGFGYYVGTVTNVIGKATAEMQSLATYVDLGWDFTTEDGDPADWYYISGSYPIPGWDVVFTMPDLTGLTFAQAQDILADNNIVPTIQYNNSDLPENTLLYQSPAAGESRSSEAVILYVSNGIQKYSGGSGTPNMPYLISNIDDLFLVSYPAVDYDKHFIMTADIDFLDGNYTFIQIAFSYGGYPFSKTKFTGTFDGNGYKIKNLASSYENSPTIYYGGMFGYLGPGCVIKNLTLDTVEVGDGSYAGGLCGYNEGGSIINCHVNNCIFNGYGYSGDHLGGLCGYNLGGTISGCSASSDIRGRNYVGGLCGSNIGGSITNSHAEGVFYGTSAVGGFCGRNTGQISGSFSNSDVTGDLVGGFCGDNAGLLLNNYSSGKVKCDSNYQWYPGGFCGTNTGKILNSYSTGVMFVRSNAYAGFCGQMSGDTAVIENCFWNVDTSYKAVGVGTLESGTVTNLQGLSTKDMKNIATYTDATWDFSVNDGDPADWQIVAGEYPIPAWDVLLNVPDVSGMTLAAAQEQLATMGISPSVQYHDSDFPAGAVASLVPSGEGVRSSSRFSLYVSTGFRKYSGGSGTENKPYKIASASDLIALRDTSSDYDKCFILTDDIDLADHIFDSAVIAPGETFYYPPYLTFYGNKFTGSFDGNGFVIRNLNISITKGGNGLFGCLSNGAQVSNLGLENVNISKANYNVYEPIFGSGGICGLNHGGKITNCYVKGAVEAGAYIGGICGYNSGDITRCFTDVAINGTGGLGGLCGTTSGVLTDNYSIGSVLGSTNIIGGYCGRNTGLIADSYSTGLVSGNGGFCGYNDGGRIIGCFWDTETSGKATSNGGTGLTTAEMQDYTTYLDAGWDFAANDGDLQVWYMPSNTYPCLAWEINPDLDGNGKIDLGDFAILANNWLSSDFQGTAPDFDRSGTIDLPDLELLASYWLEVLFVPVTVESSTLEGHWKFDEMTDQTAIDSSVFNRDGTIFGEPTLETGKIINSYSFDGVDDYVKIENYTGITGTGPRTVSAFIKADSDLNDIEKNLHAIVSWGYNATNGMWLLGLDDNTGQISLSVVGARIKGGPDLEDGNWHHVAVVFPEGATNVNQIKLYLDGQEINTNASDYDIELNTVPSQVTIGAANLSSTFDSFTPGAFFKGNIDEVRIYREALDESGIKMLAGLLGHWSLDKMTASKTEDLTGNGFVGSVVGEPSVQAGQIGNSFVFDGTDDYILVEDCYGISGNNDRTVSAFIKAEPDLDNTENNLHTIVSWGYNGASYGKWMMALDSDTGQLALALYGSRIKGGPDLEDGQWHHVAVSMIYGYIFLCVDGQVVISTQSQANTVISQVSIGAADSATTPDNFSPTSLFNGAIDDVRIYSIGMEPEQLAELANMGN